MPTPKLNSIDDYELFLGETIENWTPDQRTAFAVVMAERWLPVYEQFSQQEDWGDAPALRRALDAVWHHLGGRTLSGANRKSYVAQINDSTPHMDDFDAEEALAACVMVQEAVECCSTPNNHNYVVQASLSGFEAVLPHWEIELEEQPRLWKKSVVRKELQAQLKLIERINTIAHFDDAAITALRRDMAAPEYSGQASPHAEPETSSGYTNQAAFEQHRRMVEADIKSDERAPLNMDLDDNAYLKAIIYFSKWASRYSRRRNNTDGEYAKLADTIGLEALIARQRALDAAAPNLPDWDGEVLMVFEQCMQNALNGIEARTLTQPHSYGPSLRRLWTEATQQGKSDDGAWQHILDWAQHRPAAWQIADERKKKGRAQEAELSRRLARDAVWSTTDNVYYPWQAEVDGELWVIGITDFPDDFMYSLLVDDIFLGGFHDWPETWQRP